MKIIYAKGNSQKVRVVSNLYEEVAKLLAEEDCSRPIEVSVADAECLSHKIVYRISLRSGTRFIAELQNSMPDTFLPTSISPVFLTCVNPATNAYKFYKLERINSKVRATYGRMGVKKGELFGERTYDYPLSMFWIKYQEKLSKGYVDRTNLYLNTEDEGKDTTGCNADYRRTDSRKGGPAEVLFGKLMALAEKAVQKAEVKVPLTPAIIKESKRLLGEMRKANDVESFNNILLELIAILQRPVRTRDGTGVKRLLASSKTEFASIIQREDDLIQAMEGSLMGSTVINASAGSFENYDIEVFIATEKQKKQVLKKLNPSLQGKVKEIYRVIPQKQKEAFDNYLKTHDIKTVKQFWHGSRNQNWFSIIKNSLKLNPDAIITGKMFGNGIYFAPKSEKSWNYTSYRGTSWAGGTDDVAYMGLYATAYGTPHDVHTWSVNADYKKMTESSGGDCLHAHAGSSLLNDEIIFYTEEAVLLNYIVEFE